MRLWAVGFSASRIKPGESFLRVIAIGSTYELAIDKAQARGLSLEIAEEHFKNADGWVDRSTSCVEIPEAAMREVIASIDKERAEAARSAMETIEKVTE